MFHAIQTRTFARDDQWPLLESPVTFRARNQVIKSKPEEKERRS